ncbi:MAG: hypothetical protein M3N08_02535 [Pseudomonadota bacterium]|nr:hypothetical protein [Pseudomonadota bacterium]
MKIIPFLLLACMALPLGGCVGNALGLGLAFGGAYETRPDDLPPADTYDQIAEHESWCYETLGYPECYAHPQNVDPNRLINVDPANRYPLTSRAYKDVAIEYHE